MDINDFYWGLNQKFKLEIGMRNTIDDSYPDIIWFPQGVYVITSFSTSQNTNSFTINISGKDKMCLLNGDVGGNIPSTTDFGVIEIVNDDGTITYEYNSIKTILTELLHTYALEPYHNIILNDIEDAGLELLEYRGDTPIYLFYNESTGIYVQATVQDTMACYYESKEGGWKPGTIGSSVITYRPRVELASEISSSATKIKLTDKEDAVIYTIAKISFGETAGYRITDLTYPGDLISSIGETVTSILDKIKNMLGDFEYYYDLDGRFIFQKKPTYVNTPADGIVTIDDDTSVTAAAYTTPIEYHFENGNLITAYQNTPNLLNLKNDYTVWGNRTSVTGVDLPIHMRYAIDKKPMYYKAFPENGESEGKIYVSNLDLFSEMEEERRNEYLENIKSFMPAYGVPSNLKSPEKKEDGSWTAGWWDIRDWAEFYERITGEMPKYSMKYYSKNKSDIEYLNTHDNNPAGNPDAGYMRIGDLNIPNNQLPSASYNNYYAWLIIKNPVNQGGKYNFQHGSGTPNIKRRTKCYKAASVMLEDYHYDEKYIVNAGYGDSYATYWVDENDQPVDPGETGSLYTPAKGTAYEEFIEPYSGCTDTHTYLEFLKYDVESRGCQVFFYNPNFPGFDSFDDIVDKNFEELMKDGKLQLVDWREIIYRMAQDYYQHNQEDDFLATVKANNEGYYPTGITGYEQYYIELISFWRDVYNPKEVPTFIEYKYTIDDEEPTFSYLTGDKKSRQELYLYTKYTSAQGQTLNREQKAALQCIYNGELHDFIDTIPVNYSFDANGTQSKYYVTSGRDDSGFEPITQETSTKVEKKELYIKSGNTYTHIADTKTVDSSCFVVEDSDSPIPVSNLTPALRDLFWGANLTYRKYLTKHKLSMAGTFTDEEPLLDYITYYQPNYKFFQTSELSEYNTKYLHWNKTVRDNPDMISFWFDFLDSSEQIYNEETNTYQTVGSELDQYAVATIGDRTKVVNDKDVTSIYFREIPNLIFAKREDVTQKDLTNFTGYIFVYGISPEYFNISAQGKSAKDVVDELLYQHSYCVETINITSVPVYYLQPNVRILVTDASSNINGEYLISKITLPLTYNGTMSISATKAPTTLY